MATIRFSHENQRNAGDAYHIDSSFEDDDDADAIVPCRLEVGEFSFLSLFLSPSLLCVCTNTFYLQITGNPTKCSCKRIPVHTIHSSLHGAHSIENTLLMLCSHSWHVEAMMPICVCQQIAGFTCIRGERLKQHTAAMKLQQNQNSEET